MKQVALKLGLPECVHVQNLVYLLLTNITGITQLLLVMIFLVMHQY